VILGDIVLVMHLLLFVGIDDVHEQSGEEFDYQKLHDPFLASIREILGLLPVGEGVWFLAEAEGKEVVHFALIENHDGIDFFIFHYILHRLSVTLSRS
jgi:hypothetical protein